MADYIRRSDVLELAREYYTPALREEAVPVRAIKNIPSADVAEVRHGKWILKEILGVRLCGCSVCGKNYWWSTDNFCPNCGARMDGGK